MSNQRIPSSSRTKKTVAISKKNSKPEFSAKKSKIYKIVWRDAFSEMDEWHDYDSIDSDDYICETVGYLIEDNRKHNYYTIASTVTHDDFFCCVINIPKAMVISKKRLQF
jgi:nicotinic acid mononucleotide adenylyltransferase